MKDSALVVACMATLSAGTYAFRLSGQLLRARITFPPRAAKLLEAAAVILLAARSSSSSWPPPSSPPCSAFSASPDPAYRSR